MRSVIVLFCLLAGSAMAAATVEEMTAGLLRDSNPSETSNILKTAAAAADLDRRTGGTGETWDRVTNAAQKALKVMATNLPVHTVGRLMLSRDGAGTVWRDTLSDGTYRDSRTLWPLTPVRVHLVSTNDAGLAWRLDYEAVYTDGSNVTYRTNSDFVLKPREERYRPHAVEMPPVPNIRDRILAAKTNRPDNAWAQIAARHVDQVPITACHTQAMRRADRAVSQRLVGDRVISCMADGSIATTAVRRASTARVAASHAEPPQGGAGKAAAEAGALAVAAAAGYAAGKISGAKTNHQVDPPAGAGGAPGSSTAG